jgi:membrane protein
MTESQPVLQPKLSPVYNKIIQIISAVAIVIALLLFWESSNQVTKQTLSSHFDSTAKRHLHQASSGVLAIINSQEKQIKNKSKKKAIDLSHLSPENKLLLQSFINNMMAADYVKQIHLYGKDGQLYYQAQSTDTVYKSLEHGKQQYSINEIYGLDGISDNKSKTLKPFITELRGEHLYGYLRLTIDKKILMNALIKSEIQSTQNIGFMLILAGVVGFLLTRGFNRFSRQGFRPF